MQNPSRLSNSHGQYIPIVFIKQSDHAMRFQAKYRTKYRIVKCIKHCARFYQNCG